MITTPVPIKMIVSNLQPYHGTYWLCKEKIPTRAVKSTPTLNKERSHLSTGYRKTPSPQRKRKRLMGMRRVAGLTWNRFQIKVDNSTGKYAPGMNKFSSITNRMHMELGTKFLNFQQTQVITHFLCLHHPHVSPLHSSAPPPLNCSLLSLRIQVNLLSRLPQLQAYFPLVLACVFHVLPAGAAAAAAAAVAVAAVVRQ